MSEEYDVVAALLAEAKKQKVELLKAQQEFNMSEVNGKKAWLQDRLDRFVVLQGQAPAKAADALQKHVDGLQESYDYWDGPEPGNERTKLGPQIAEASQLIGQLTTLLGTLTP